MKKIVLAGIICLSLFLISGPAYAEGEMAYVDLGQVFDQYKKTQEYDKVLEKEQKDYEQQRDEKLEGVKKLQEKLSLLSDKEKEAQRGDLEDKITQLQEFDRNSTQDLRKHRDEKVQEIFQDINNIINDYAKNKRLSLIFDSRALVYIDESLDITDQILKELNK